MRERVCGLDGARASSCVCVRACVCVKGEAGVPRGEGESPCVVLVRGSPPSPQRCRGSPLAVLVSPGWRYQQPFAPLPSPPGEEK